MGAGPITEDSAAHRPGAGAAGSERERRVWRAVAIIVLTLTVLAGAGMAWGAMAYRATTTSRTFLAPVAAVEINAAGAQVRVEAGAPDRVTVDQRADWALRQPSVDESLHEGTLRISVHCGTVVGPLDTDAFGCGLLLDIRIPAGVPVRARGTSGGFTARGLSGEIRVETTSGAIRLDAVSGPVWAKATSGQITGEALASSRIRAVLTSGQLLLMFARPPVEVTATATSGQVDLGLPADPAGYRIDHRTTSGAVDISPALRSDTSTHHIDIATSSGQISVEKATT
ncbi:DUF4097 family beta strand repeat-containing protein [Streptomyces sp. NRRL B-24484]|uniref:DUF4097 family beta strand repeat-containing protein n=1 Tax=Streptomyces sp. NRRL B-24484 TaxID=1463833 RepID=UPI0004BE4F76|nr:DUF4097 family beta strand repeat-containing protein [Streptomyces sp. NRRL B-24484]